MQTDSPLRRDVRPTDGAPAPVGSDELAEGLMLVRESTLKIIRFQLAMERHDRRVALEAVDDLVALDRRLRDYLGDVPAPELEHSRQGALQVLQAALARCNDAESAHCAENSRGRGRGNKGINTSRSPRAG